MSVTVGDVELNPRDVAAISRGVGPESLTLTIRAFPFGRGWFGAVRKRRCGTRHRDVKLRFKSERELELERDRLTRLCMPNGATWSDAEKKKRLLVLVNPAAGKGNDVSAYERDVAPVLECAFDRARIDVVVTTRRGEAQERVASMDLQNTAAVVCVGGDGTIAEVFNGLMSRGGAAEKFPIGMIPAGSGNAIAKSLAHAGGEPCDRASAALAVARGHIAPLDRAEVSGQRVGSLSITRTRSGRKITSPAAAGLGPTAGSSAGNGDAAATAATASVMHSLLSFSWGFFADVDIESETMRWLGGLRFTIQAIVRILFLRRYSAKLRFKPLAITPDAVPAGKKSKELAIGQVSLNLRGYKEPKEAAAVAAMDGASAGDAIADRPGWREIEGDVQGLWALNLPWGGEDMYAAPGAAPDDGCYDLLVIAGASRLSLLGLLLIFDGGAHCTHPAVTYVKASAFELDPGPSHTGKGGFIAVDGELVARADGKWGRTRQQDRRTREGDSDDERKMVGGGSGAKGSGGHADVARHKHKNGSISTVTGDGEGWRAAYAPMSMRVVRAAARVFCAPPAAAASGGRGKVAAADDAGVGDQA